MPRDFVEEADIPKDSQAKPEPLQQRTVQQQEKQTNYIKQQKRLEGGESNRSRSASRRDRRKRIREQLEEGKYMKTAPLEALEEADANGELHTMQRFERIGPDSTSMDGPVTYARAMRGEIPVRGSNPNQPYYMTPQETSSVSRMPAVSRDGGRRLTSSAERAEGYRRPEAHPRSESGHRNRAQGQRTRRPYPLTLVSVTPFLCKYLMWVGPKTGNSE